MAKRTVPARVSSGEPPALRAAKPWAALTQAERLAANADRALDVTRQILELPVDPDNPKLLGHIKEVALTVIGQQIRVSEGLRDKAAEQARGQLLLEDLQRRLDERREAGKISVPGGEFHGFTGGFTGVPSGKSAR